MDRNEDLQFESSDEEASTHQSADELKRLRAKLKEVESKAADYLAGWQRAKADYINLKQEQDKTNRGLAVLARRPLLLELIHLADIFDLAFANHKSWPNLPANWRQGMEHIHKELIKILEHNGVTSQDPLGDKFDPQQHDSVGVLETTDPNDDNRIVQVLKKGYYLSGQVIRPAQVKVGALKE